MLYGFQADSKYAKCCGDIEEFSLEEHGRLLISSSNSWINIWGWWKDYPLLKEVSDELADSGCYGAATHLNAFIEKLARNYEEE